LLLVVKIIECILAIYYDKKAYLLLQYEKMDERSENNLGVSHAKSYVVAVSGGVDSVVLLDILVKHMPASRLVVAHFDHGIRDDSAADRQFVQTLAQRYGLGFAFDEGHLGAAASEAVAREARYNFLRKAKAAAKADHIITAHHEDDVFETAILNLLRGTGRKGLSSLRSTNEIYRPLLATPKDHIRAYATKHGLQWREDSTNANDDYLRNYVRHNIMSRFDTKAKQRLRDLIAATRNMNIEIDSLLAEQLHLQPGGDTLDRQWFIMLPHNVAREIIAAWLRRLGVTDFNRQLLEQIVVAGKTFAAGKQVDVNGRYIIKVSNERLVIGLRAV